VAMPGRRDEREDYCPTFLVAAAPATPSAVTRPGRGGPGGGVSRGGRAADRREYRQQTGGIAVSLWTMGGLSRGAHRPFDLERGVTGFAAKAIARHRADDTRAGIWLHRPGGRGKCR
jgi:hypothetical protein